MGDRLQVALSFVKKELDPEFLQFLDAIEDIMDNCAYYDYNGFDEWVDDDSEYGCEAYVREVLGQFLR